MATYTGKSGVFQVGAAPGIAFKNLRNWAVTETAGVPTGAHTDSAGWTDAVVGVKSWSGSFDFYQDSVTEASGVLSPGDIVVVQLVDGIAGSFGWEYSGTVVISDVSFNDDIFPNACL